MNDQQFDHLLEQSIPTPDENAKKIAINEALETFSQGFDKQARLTNNRENWFLSKIKLFGSYLMTPQKNSRFYGTAASIAVAFVAVSVYLLTPSLKHQAETTTNVSEIISAHNASTTTLEDTTESETDQIINIEIEEITVSGAREVTQNSINEKKVNTQIVDDLSSDQIGNIPPLSIGEALEVITAAPAPSSPRSQSKISLPSNQSFSKSRSTENKSIASQPRPLPHLPTPIEPNNPAPSRLDDGEEYPEYENSAIKRVSEEPVSTFSIDVDTASYSLVRNQLNNGFLPKTNAVRAEELINYFDYNYPLPDSKSRPFKPTITVLDSPWNEGKKLVHIGIKGYEIQSGNTPDSNIVFLLDVSGSMNSANKLPLVKQSLNLLLDTLKPTDTVSMVVYAGAAGVVLEPTQVKNKTTILEAVKNLRAGGSTAGGEGIELAYQLAEQNFDKDSVNRIFLATDGDFNIGMRNNDDLKKLVERKRDKGVFLSVLGFGRNNYQDDMMQTLAQNGNGVAAYIDTLSEAKKVLVDEATSTLFPIAKDVKIQVEFNPTTVSEYRLIGYETRALKREDFNNDKIDAGDIGAGHTVTAIYEITPADSESQSIDKPRYAGNIKETPTGGSKTEYGYVKIRYKSPTGTKSKLIEQAISVKQNKNVNSEVLFSTAVASFAQLLANSDYTGELSYDDIIEVAKANKGDDEFGYRSEFIQLVRMAEIAEP